MEMLQNQIFDLYGLIPFKNHIVLPFNKYFRAPTRCQELNHQNSSQFQEVQFRNAASLHSLWKDFLCTHQDAIEDNSQHRHRHRQHPYQWRSISFLPQCHHPPSLLLEYCSWLPKPWAWITNPLLSQEPGQIQLLSSPPTRKAACLNPSKPFLNDTHLYPTLIISSTAKNRMDPSQTGFTQLELLTTHAYGLYLQSTLSVDTV